MESLRALLDGRPEWGASVVYGTCDGETLLLNAHRYNPACFLLDLALGGDELQAVLQALQRAGYREFLFLGSPEGHVELPGEVIPWTAPVASLVSAVNRLVIRPGADAHGESAPGVGRRRPVLLAVHSPKGGVGKTFLACSLGVQYASRGLRTILVDLAVYGGVAPALGLPRREKGLGRLVVAFEQFQSALEIPSMGDLLRSNLAQFPAGDHTLDLLLAGPPLKMPKLGLEMTDALMRWLLSEPYDVIIIDTSIEPSERAAVALKAADAALLVMTPELPAAWAILSMHDLLKNLNVGGNLQVVLNRSASDPTVARELESVVGYPVVASIPEVDSPWVKGVGRNLGFDYSPFGLALKHLAQRYQAIYRPAEIPAAKR